MSSEFNTNTDERIFHAYIREYQVIDKNTLFSPFAKAYFGAFHKERSTIYLIAKTKRLTLHPESFAISTNYCVEGDVTFGRSRERVVFNIAKVLFEQHAPKDHWNHWRHWADAAMRAWKSQDKPEAEGDSLYRICSSVDLRQSTGDELYIDCKLFQSRDGNEERRVILSPIQLANFFDWYLRDHIEVLYVGKSTDDALKRLRNHNKWGEITTDLGTDEVAVVYFMEIEEALFSRTSVGPVTFLSSTRDEDIDRDSVALITEAALIKHFFADEKYNRQVVAQDLTEVKSVREKLLSRGYSAIQVELDLEGSLGILGTPKTGFVRRHEFVHRLRDL